MTPESVVTTRDPEHLAVGIGLLPPPTGAGVAADWNAVELLASAASNAADLGKFVGVSCALETMGAINAAKKSARFMIRAISCLRLRCACAMGSQRSVFFRADRLLPVLRLVVGTEKIRVGV